MLSNDLMGDVIRKVTDRKDPEKVEAEIERVLQALEELSPKQSRQGGKIQMVSEESQDYVEAAKDAGEAFYGDWYGEFIMFVE